MTGRPGGRGGAASPRHTRRVTSHRVLVVEDDHGLRDVLKRGLVDEGFAVSVAVDGRSAVQSMVTAGADVVVMDINLPDSDGRDVCTALRARGVATPVLFLTARGGLTDRLSGFAAGGDDYLAKPFHVAELVVRLQALLKRSVGPAVATHGDLRLDPSTYDLTGPQASTPLSPTEFRLLATLLASPGVVVRRRQLIAAAWPQGAIVSDNTLDQYVSRLRRKLLEVRSECSIEATKGVGFRLA
jgi:DNA-binding response OmpR family regulator